MFRKLAVLMLSVCIVEAASQTVRAGMVPGFMGLGAFTTNNWTARGISSDGSIVVGGGYTMGHTESLRWTQSGGVSSIGSMVSGYHSSASAISADGITIVGSGITNSSGQTEAFRWTQSDGMVGLGHLAGGGPVAISTANEISADGSVIVGCSTSSSTSPGLTPCEAFRWTSAGGMIGLGDLAGGTYNSAAHGVSADGSVIVGTASGPTGELPFRWTEATGMVSIGALPAGVNHGNAAGVSSDGSIIVGSLEESETTEGYMWTQGSGYVRLGGLYQDLAYSIAYGISGDGTTIVGESFIGDFDAQFPLQAFIWDSANGMRNLNTVLTELGINLNGWTLVDASDVSFDGKTIIGRGYNPDGAEEFWIATLPEPASASLVLIGAMALLHPRRSRR